MVGEGLHWLLTMVNSISHLLAIAKSRSAPPQCSKINLCISESKQALCLNIFLICAALKFMSSLSQTRWIIEQLQYLLVIFALWLCQVETISLSNGDRIVYVEKDKVVSLSAF